MGKTLYHSELAKCGMTHIDITSDLIASKFKAGTYIVGVVLAGEERTLNVEGPLVQQEVTDRKGQRLHICATSRKDHPEEATLGITRAEWTPEGDTPAPAAVAPAKPPARPVAKPPQARAERPPGTPTTRPAPSQAPNPTPPAAPPEVAPAPPAPTPTSKGGPTVSAELFRLSNLELKIEVFVSKIAETLALQRGIVLTDERRGAIAGRVWIHMTRLGMHVALPADHLIDVTPPEAPAPEGGVK